MPAASPPRPAAVPQTRPSRVGARAAGEGRSPTRFLAVKFAEPAARSGEWIDRQVVMEGIGDNTAIMSETSPGVVEHAAEGTVWIEIDARHCHFLDPQPEPGGLHPQLQRHA